MPRWELWDIPARISGRKELTMMGGWMMAGFGILLLLAVGLAVLVLLRPSPGAGRGISRPWAKDLLDQRYARGEIDDDGYRRRLSVLDSTEPMTRTSD